MNRTASVIVRSRDRAHSIEATLRALRSQTIAVEIVVVDSGSIDATVEIAQRYADHVVHLRPEEFTYGGALNAGAAVASGDIHFALSAHCVPSYDDWVEGSMAHYSDPSVAATNHQNEDPEGAPLRGPYRQTAQDPWRNPFWGFSNHASSWRADVWREHRFREDLVACEDKEWSWRVLAAGWSIVYDPHLLVPASHRRAEDVRTSWARHHKEGAALAGLGAIARPTRADVLRAWLTVSPDDQSRWPTWIRRCNPWRSAEVLGLAVGSHSVRAETRPTLAETLPLPRAGG